MSARTALLSVAATIAAAAMSVGAAAQTRTIETTTLPRWQSIGHAACMERAAMAVEAAIRGFALPRADVRVAEWFVLGQNDGINLWIECIADDDTTALAGPGAERVLMVVFVASDRSRLGDDIATFLGECMLEGVCPPVANASATPIGWRDSAELILGTVGERFPVECPAYDGGPFPQIWGTDVYTADSSICVAAVHAGLITLQGGAFAIEILAGQEAYPGSARNGVLSNTWRSYPRSFGVRPSAI